MIKYFLLSAIILSSLIAEEPRNKRWKKWKKI